MKKILAICLAVILLFSIAGFAYNTARKSTSGGEEIVNSNAATSNDNSTLEDQDIVILFTSDLHGAVDDNMTLSQIAAYKKEALNRTPYVVLVDCGDQYQGSYLGSVSKGQAELDMMNLVGYDFAIFGNHEFDFGMQRLHELVDMSTAQYLNCNITYSGSGTSAVEKSVPYKIVEFGNKKVAFIGVTTPTTIQDSTPSFFMENGEFVYDFCQGENGQKLYDVVQKNVDEVTAQGADYVILISHLGASMQNDADIYSSEELIKHTHGISAVLDGHSHLIFDRIETNEYDEPVAVAQAGTKINSMGQVVISKNDFVSVSIYDTILGEIPEITNDIKAIKDKYNSTLLEKVTTLEQDISIVDNSGIRMSRNQEIPLGNLVSDAFRIRTGADIAYINGGGLRDGFKAGDVTYKDIINVLPFGNMVCTVEVTGQEILDMLEYFSRTIDKTLIDVEHSRPMWEDGAFPHVSGMKFTVDTSVQTPVETDDNAMLIGIEEGQQRRVSNVMILQNDTYVPIDVNKTYIFASTDYTCKNGGNGMEFLLKDHNILQDCVKEDYLALYDYITENLDGDLSGYYELDRRITIK